MGIPHGYLGLLRAEGTLSRVGRGVYRTAAGLDTRHLALAEAAKTSMDVFKALALAWRRRRWRREGAVMAGLAANGADGVRRVL